MWNRLRWILIALGLALVIAVVAMNFPTWYENWRLEREATQQVVYVVPKGTVSKIGSGQAVNVLPGMVALTVGSRDTLVIRNEDDFPLEVGGLRIKPGEQYIQKFTRAGTFDLVCSVHTSERIRVVVSLPR
jgi:hypothetical protein